MKMMVGNDEDSSLLSRNFSFRATLVKINRTTKAGYPCYSGDLFLRWFFTVSCPYHPRNRNRD